MFNKFFTWLLARKIEGETYLREKGQKGVSSAGIMGILVLALMVPIAYQFLAAGWTSMQTANTAIQASTATDAGTVNSKTFFGILLWALPIGVGIALFMRTFSVEGGRISRRRK